MLCDYNRPASNRTWQQSALRVIALKIRKKTFPEHSPQYLKYKMALVSRTACFIPQQENPYSFPVLCCLFCQGVKIPLASNLTIPLHLTTGIAKIWLSQKKKSAEKPITEKIFLTINDSKILCLCLKHNKYQTLQTKINFKNQYA